MNTPNPKLRALLSSPMVGFAPWILMAVVEGPGRVVLAACLAGALAVALTAGGAALGLRPKLLDITGIGYFAALAVAAAVAGPGTSQWLGTWSGELSSVVIAVIVGLSLAARRPFTLAYARESTPREYWHTPQFLRINYVITAAWGAVFLIDALVGYIGDGPLHQPDNVWMSWVIPVALVVLAIKFTAWYPDHATAGSPAAADGPRRHASLASLLLPVASWLIPAGILVMIVGHSFWWAGLILMLAGIFGGNQLRQAGRRALPRTGPHPLERAPSGPATALPMALPSRTDEFHAGTESVLP
jgi:hypothetical protein